MKHVLLILLVVFACTTKAQVPPSNIATVYSYEVGDTLQYRTAYYEQLSGVVQEGFLLKVITGKVVSADTLIYNYSGYRIFTTLSPPTMPLTSYISDSIKIAHPDSLITTVNPELTACQVSSANCFDSVFTNADYNGKKQYWHYRNDLSRADIKYADSLGCVYSNIFTESVPATDLSELIYYHKTSGETWGTYNLMVGVIKIAGNIPLEVFPNPANNQLHITTNNPTPKTISIYCITGGDALIKSNLTARADLDISALAPGIYVAEVRGNDGAGQCRFVKQ